MPRTPKKFPKHGPELRALLVACHREPDDDTPRLVLADWLQEHDDPRAELVRLQVRLNAMPAGDPEYDTLFEQHQKWWKKYAKLWERDVDILLSDAMPHTRGLPVLGDCEDDDRWVFADDLADNLKDPVSGVIATGWPSLVWVFAAEPVDDEGEDLYPNWGAAEAAAFAPFDRPPWSESPSPLGIAFPDSLILSLAVIDRVAKIPNVRGISLVEAQANTRVLPRIAKIKNLEHLDLDTLKLTDDAVKVLAPLKKLRTLIARESSITNAGAKQLAKFTELRELRLGARRLTADGYQSLAQLSKLEVLELAKANDGAIQHLTPLARLRHLHLSDTEVTGRGLENFPLLKELHLDHTPADDAGMECLSALPRLQFLDVSETEITGATLTHVAGLKWLQHFYAASTNIRDKAVVHLEGLKHLESLDLRDTHLTKKRLSQLQEKLKDVAIY